MNKIITSGVRSRMATCKPGTHTWVRDYVTLTATCSTCKLIIGASIDTLGEDEQRGETPEKAYDRAMRGV